MAEQGTRSFARAKATRYVPRSQRLAEEKAKKEAEEEPEPGTRAFAQATAARYVPRAERQAEDQAKAKEEEAKARDAGVRKFATRKAQPYVRRGGANTMDPAMFKAAKKAHEAGKAGGLAPLQEVAPLTAPKDNGSSGRKLKPIDFPDPEIKIIDYEEECVSAAAKREKMRDMVDFPADNLEIVVEPRIHRTCNAVLPEMDGLEGYIQTCVRYFQEPYTVLRRNYTKYGVERKVSTVSSKELPDQRYEIDAKQREKDIAQEKKHHGESVKEKVDLRDMFAVPGTDTGEGETVESGEGPGVLGAGDDADLLDRSVLGPHTVMSEDRNREQRSKERFPIFRLFSDPENTPLARDDADALRSTMQTASLRVGGTSGEALLLGDSKRINGDPFTIEFAEDRFMMTAKSFELKAMTQDIEEPFFFSATLVDLKERKRISENFCFNFNKTYAEELLGVYRPHKDRETDSLRGVFNVTYPSENVVMLIRVEKVLEGDIDTPVELYMKEELRDKGKRKRKDNLLSFVPRLGKFRQPFAWCWFPVFGPRGQLKAPATHEITNLYRARSHGMTDEGLMDLISEMREKDKRHKIVVGTLTMEVERVSSSFPAAPPEVPEEEEEEEEEGKEGSEKKEMPVVKEPALPLLSMDLGADMMVLNESLKCVKPPPNDPNTAIVVREIQEFPQYDKYEPAVEYVNNLYVYPEAVDVSHRSGFKVRNVSVRVQLMDCDNGPEDQGVNAVYGESCEEKMKDGSYSPVTYHNKRPEFYQEVKIELPANLTSRHNLLFTFYHVAVQPPKKMTGSPPPPEVAVAYAMLPLYNNDRILEKDEHEVPLAMDLPVSYLAKFDTAKFVDGGKPLFRFRTKLVSTVYCRDPHLAGFFRVFQSKTNEKLQAAFAREVVDSSPNAVIRFLPILLRELCAALCLDTSVEVRVAVFSSMLKILDLVRRKTQEGAGRTQALVSLVMYHLDVAGDLQGARPLYEALAFHMMDVLESTGKKKARDKELMVKYAWFLYEAMVKSMALHSHRRGLLKNDKNRKERVAPEFYVQLNKLTDLVRKEIETRSRTGLTLAKDLVHTLALLIQDMFSLVDRGEVFKTVSGFVRQLVPRWDNEVLIEMNFEFISQLCHYEHFVPLNLPLRSPIKDVKNLRLTFWERHFMSGLLLHEVLKALRHHEKNIRHRAVVVIRDLFNKHDFDERYQDKDRRERLALLYFPLILMMTDDVEVIKGLEEVEKRDVLISFLWVLKNSSARVLNQWWKRDTQSRLLHFIALLEECARTFQYIGRRALIKKADTQDTKSVSASTTKAMLEQMYSGAGSFRSAQRRSVRGSTLRDTRRGRSFGSRSMRGRGSLRAEVGDFDVKLEANLSTEVSTVILDVLELFMTQKERDLLQKPERGPTPLMDAVFNVLSLFIDNNLSDRCVQMGFATLRGFVQKFTEQLFSVHTHYLVRLIPLCLKYCNSMSALVRAEAAGFFYVLMKANQKLQGNFIRTKIQMTIATSKLRDVDKQMRRSLAAIAACAERDTDTMVVSGKDKKEFVKEVKDLMHRLHAIVRDTVKMKEFTGDEEMTADIYYRIAKGYTNAPDLRVAWLENLAAFHRSGKRHAEAAMCILHVAGLVSEYLHLLEPTPGLPVGCVAFKTVSPNLVEESSISEASAEEEGICEGEAFSEKGLIGLLETAREYLRDGLLHENIVGLYKVLIPIYEKNRNWSLMAKAHEDLAGICREIDACEKGKARAIGSYYRIGFYGSRLGELNGKEFIYKEPKITMLAEITIRLKKLFGKRVGEKNLEIIKSSQPVEVESLDAEKAYIQITSVQPYHETWEKSTRVSWFSKNNNVSKFLFETPFTKSGKARGSTIDQYKRKTICEVKRTFPYVTKRMLVTNKSEVVLTPIEGAVEAMEMRCAKVQSELDTIPPNTKSLQQVLQGSVRLQVNAGVMEFAKTFLTEPDQFPKKHVRRLRAAFKVFIKACGDALRLNATLIEPEQLEYHEDLEKGYRDVREMLEPYLSSGKGE